MGVRRERFEHRLVDGIGVGVALAVLGTAVWFGVRPIFEFEEITRRLSGQMVGSKQQLESVRDEHRQLQDSIDSVRAELDELAVALDNSDQLAARQAAISGLFSSAGVRVSQFTVGSVQPGVLVDALPLQVSGEGASSDVIGAMHALRATFPDVAVTGFRIARGGRGGEGHVTFGFDLAWYIASDGSSEG